MVRDIDLLFRDEDLDRSVGILRALGYRDWTLQPAGRRAFGNLVRDGDPAALDIHREIIEPPHLIPAASFWTGCRRADLNGVRALVPSAEHRVLHVVMHEMVHNEGYIRGILSLRALHDLHRLVSGLPAVAWGPIFAHLERREALPPFAAMAYAADRLLGTVIPVPPGQRAAARMFHLRFALRRRGVLPERVHRWWMYAHKAVARHYFDPARDNPPIMSWRVRRVSRFALRALRGDWPRA